MGLESQWEVYSLAPANLIAEGGISILPDDSLAAALGSASLNDAKVLEGASAYQGTLAVWVRPNWDSSYSGFRYIFDFGFVDLYWDGGNTEWKATVNGVDIVKAGSFTAGVWIYLHLTWDVNAPTLDLEVDGSSATQVTTVQTAGTPSGGYIGQDSLNSFAFNGVIKYRLSSAIESSFYAAGAGSADLFLVGSDVRLVDRFTEDSTGVIRCPRGQKIQSISTVTLTTVDNVVGRFVDNERVVVYDDSDPANSVFTAINGTPSGTTITVDDSCAAVIGTNKFITRNLLLDADFEAAGVANVSAGAHQTITKDTAVIKFDVQSLKDIWASADSGDESAVWSPTLVNGRSYWYKFWVYISAIDAASNLHFDIDGAANIVSRQIDTGSDDKGTPYAVDTWLYYEGVFQADQNGAHNFNLRIATA